jgi:nitrile hydratase accessory protein
LSAPDALSLPGIPRDAEGPVFREPWQAQVFALAVQLSAEGAFTWPEWAEALSRELAGDPTDDGSRYYAHWVAALEALAASRGLAASAEMAQRKADWAEAYRRTPHGAPIELSAAFRAT